MTQIWWPNLKKCSSLSFTLLFYASCTPVWGATLSPKEIYQTIHKELLRHQTPNFETLLNSWTLRYGNQAFLPLIEIAKERSLQDPIRYMALMGAAKTGGRNSAHSFKPFLKNPSWMIRNAALKCLRILNNPTNEIFPLLHDPALVVRSEAITSVQALKPQGSMYALIDTLLSPENYHHGKALIIPQKAIKALEAITGKQTPPGPLEKQIQFWKQDANSYSSTLHQ